MNCQGNQSQIFDLKTDAIRLHLKHGGRDATRLVPRNGGA